MDIISSNEKQNVTMLFIIRFAEKPNDTTIKCYNNWFDYPYQQGTYIPEALAAINMKDEARSTLIYV